MANLNELFPLVRTSNQGLKELYTPYNPKTIPGLDMYSMSMNPSVYGFVDSQEPSRIALNNRANFKTGPQVVPHEIEHVLQNRVDNRYEQGYDGQVISNYAKASGVGYAEAKNRLINSLESSAIDKSIPEHFSKNYNYPIKYYGSLDRGEMDLREQWAEISAAEQYLKKDLTKDPFVRKKMFNNDQFLIDTYRGASGLRTDRWDAKDLAPMTNYSTPVQQSVAPQQQPQSGMLEKLFNMFK